MLRSAGGLFFSVALLRGKEEMGNKFVQPWTGIVCNWDQSSDTKNLKGVCGLGDEFCGVELRAEEGLLSPRCPTKDPIKGSRGAVRGPGAGIFFSIPQGGGPG